MKFRAVLGPILLLLGTVQGATQDPKFTLQLTSQGAIRYLSFTPRGSFFLNHFAPQGDIHAIRIRYVPEDTAVRFQVLLFKEPYNRFATLKQLDAAPQELIAEFSLGLEEQIMLSQLSQYALEPVHLKLVKSFSETVSPLQVVVQSSAVVVDEIKERPDAFMLTVSNLSQKGVICLEIGQRFSAWPGQHVIAPLGRRDFPVYKRVRRLDRQENPEPYQIDLAAVVFEDFTFEGDRAKVMRFILEQRGFEVGLPEVLQVLRSTLDGERKEPRESARDLFVAIGTIIENTSIPPREIERAHLALQAWHPISREDVERHLTMGYEWARRAFLESLQANFPRLMERADPNAAFWEWLGKTYKQFNVWQEELKRIGLYVR